ncbi:hypothetical protein CCHL11_01543 [Colletotrichum chlorophyti]|uniref:Uncharacterized protein n=1 Tax=Colletotrichum chlorophyti TaxID=708187 RepID=A0A1Q8RY97_9PEZI|nr:hypothetical protein CCHL11_01543 [Colletotrichum chlorophyti]
MTGVDARPGPMPNLQTMHPEAFTHGCSRKDCFHEASGADCEFHSNLVRDIIKTRRDHRRARLQQRCRTPNDMTTAVVSAPTSRSVTPLRRQTSQSSKPGSPQSFASSDFSPCVSPLMEDLMIEVEDAIDSNGTPPEPTIIPERTTSMFNLDDIFKLIDEAQREYESLGESQGGQGRTRMAHDRFSWESLLGHP